MTAYHRILLGVGSVLTGLWVVLAAYAPLLAPFDPNDVLVPLQQPGAALPVGGTVWFGTDLLGRDIFSRAIWAARASFGLIGGAIVVAYVIGLPIAFAATARSRILALPARGIAAVFRGVPVFIGYLVLIFIFGLGSFAFVVAFAFASLPSLVDLVAALRRALAREGSERPGGGRIAALFATDALKRLVFWAAIAAGIGSFGLSPFLPPAPTFGGMFFESRSMALSFPHTVLAPIGVLIALLLGASLLAAGLEARLPASLRSADPAWPSYRPGNFAGAKGAAPTPSADSDPTRETRE